MLATSNLKWHSTVILHHVEVHFIIFFFFLGLASLVARQEAILTWLCPGTFTVHRQTRDLIGILGYQSRVPGILQESWGTSTRTQNWKALSRLLLLSSHSVHFHLFGKKLPLLWWHCLILHRLTGRWLTSLAPSIPSPHQVLSTLILCVCWCAHMGWAAGMSTMSPDSSRGQWPQKGTKSTVPFYYYLLFETGACDLNELNGDIETESITLNTEYFKTYIPS